MDKKTKPEEVILSYIDLINNSDLDSIMNLYDSGAAMVVQSGEVIHGREKIRQLYQGFLGKSKFYIKIKRVVITGDIALVIGNWTIDMLGEDNKPVNLSGTSADVLRKQLDGTWLVVVDNAWEMN